MAKTCVVNARIEPEVKTKAESIYSQLGLTLSEAIALFLRQSMISGGLPFELKLPEFKSREEMVSSLKDAADRYARGEVEALDADEVFKDLRSRYGI